jgi:hypothetical protein
MLAVAGCSSDSGSDSDDKSGAESSAATTARPSPTVVPAKFSGLPDACRTISRKTVDSLVPKAKVKGGTAGKSSDIATRGSCSWNGLDDKGVKGSQYRWLDVSLIRYDSDATLGSGAKRAGEYYTKEVESTQGTEDAKDVKTAPATGLGNEASVVTYTLKKTGVNFAYSTVVTRNENVVVTLTFNGAGYAGAKSPSSSDLTKNAEKAAKEAVTAVSGGSGQASGGGGASEDPSENASGSKSPSRSPEASASRTASE